MPQYLKILLKTLKNSQLSFKDFLMFVKLFIKSFWRILQQFLDGENVMIDGRVVHVFIPCLCFTVGPPCVDDKLWGLHWCGGCSTARGKCVLLHMWQVTVNSWMILFTFLNSVFFVRLHIQVRANSPCTWYIIQKLYIPYQITLHDYTTTQVTCMCILQGV